MIIDNAEVVLIEPETSSLAIQSQSSPQNTPTENASISKNPSVVEVKSATIDTNSSYVTDTIYDNDRFEPNTPNAEESYIEELERLQDDNQSGALVGISSPFGTESSITSRNSSKTENSVMAKNDFKNSNTNSAHLIETALSDIPTCSRNGHCDKTRCGDLEQKFKELQMEHKKLMVVTTELTSALQTHIFGQSENLNSMLNTCKDIYPDLFKTPDFTEYSKQHIQSETQVEDEKWGHPRETLEAKQHDTVSLKTVELEEGANSQATLSKNHQLPNVPSLAATRSANIKRPYSSNAVTEREEKNLSKSNSLVRTLSNRSCDANLLAMRPSSSNAVLAAVTEEEEKEMVKSKSKVETLSNKSCDANLLAMRPSSSNAVLAAVTEEEEKEMAKSMSQVKTLSNKSCNADLLAMRSSSSNAVLAAVTKKEEKEMAMSKSQVKPLSNKSCDANLLVMRPSSSNAVLAAVTEEEESKMAKSKSQVKTLSNKSCDAALPVMRPSSSNAVLATVTEDEQNKMAKSKSLVRTLSCKSCDGNLSANASTMVKSSETDLSNENVESDDTEKDIEGGETQSINDDSNLDNESNRNFATNVGSLNSLPEVYVTTENMARAQERCECAFGGSRINQMQNYFDLDFRRLKKDMLIGAEEIKLNIIQALRWRITRSEPEYHDQVISCYIRHDLLGLHSAPNPNGQSTLEMYLCPKGTTPHLLQEEMSRLINTFASLTLGRDYLCQDEDLLVSLLIPLVMGMHYTKVAIDDITRDMLMATLQKLSIRNKQRLKMISAGLTEHLVMFLSSNSNSISEYCLEYTTALLMNLCLEEEARQRLRPLATDVVGLLADFLNTNRRNCMPYVNGTMYSLLSDPYINDEAKHLNLSKLIEYLIPRTDGEVQKQLRYILDLHWNCGNQRPCECNSSIQPETEFDLLESELDNGDVFRVEPSGEEFLEKFRLVFSPYGAQVQSTSVQCFCRPATPKPRSTDAKVGTFNGQEALPKIYPNYKTPTRSVSTSGNSTHTSKPNRDNPDRASPQIIYPNSEMSYSEETKQFYHTPSSTARIFETSKAKKLHHAPHSFTRTIAMPKRTSLNPTICNNPHCPHPYAKRVPFKPKTSSSITNPPYALDYISALGSCYRHTCKIQNRPLQLCGACNQHHIDLERANSSTPKPTINLQAKQNVVNTDPRMAVNGAVKRTFQNEGSAVNQCVDFRFQELRCYVTPMEQHNVRRDDCQCYEAVFQSRPRILRTPP